MIKRLPQLLFLLAIAISILVKAGYATPGTVLFSDDFNSGSASCWVVDQGNWSVVNGAYHQRYSDIYGEGLEPALGGRRVSHIAGSNYGDFDATAEAEAVSSMVMERKLAIIFRAQDLQNFYRFRWLTGNLDGDDHTELWKYVNGTPVLITRVRMDPAPVGTKLVFKFPVTDSTYASGFFGLATYHTEGFFDNVRIVS